MKAIVIGGAVVGALVMLALATALVLIASAFPRIAKPADVFGFASLRKDAAPSDDPGLRRYPARDGEQLAYRLHESSADRILIFIHGSTYHGAGYQALASFLSDKGTAKVVLPNLRGHYQSGRRRGDVEHIGQFEDDIADLIAALRSEGLTGPIVLGGHSSGGGFVIRFAGSPHAAAVTGYLMLSPIIPTSPAIRGGNAGGWANLHLRRLYGMLALNMVGIHGFDGLPIIEFNKPAEFWDGTETLTYSYRLNASYHPHFRYQGDMQALGKQALALVGERDEAIDADALRTLFASHAPQARFGILPAIDHFAIFRDPAALKVVDDWMQTLPGAR